MSRNGAICSRAIQLAVRGVRGVCAPAKRDPRHGGKRAVKTANLSGAAARADAQAAAQRGVAAWRLAALAPRHPPAVRQTKVWTQHVLALELRMFKMCAGRSRAHTGPARLTGSATPLASSARTGPRRVGQARPRPGGAAEAAPTLFTIKLLLRGAIRGAQIAYSSFAAGMWLTARSARTEW